MDTGDLNKQENIRSAKGHIEERHYGNYEVYTTACL